MSVLGLRFCARAFSSCGKRGPLFIVVRGPLTVAASPVAEHRLQTRRLSNCGSRAQPFRGMRDPPRPGLEPVSPALAGRFSTTAPPGKPRTSQFISWLIIKRNVDGRTLWNFLSSFFLNFLNFLHNFKGYFPVIVITKYWPYSLCCTIHPWGYLTPSSLLLPLPHPYIAPPPVPPSNH